MPNYRMVVHLHQEYEAEDMEAAIKHANYIYEMMGGQLLPHVEEIVEHKAIAGYECTHCCRNITPMYEGGMFLCPWCRSVEHVKTRYKEEEK